jgi:hypothetical protein
MRGAFAAQAFANFATSVQFSCRVQGINPDSFSIRPKAAGPFALTLLALVSTARAS